MALLLLLRAVENNVFGSTTTDDVTHGDFRSVLRETWRASEDSALKVIFVIYTLCGFALYVGCLLIV